MIKVTSNPIIERYDRSPIEGFAAVRLTDEVFKKVIGFKPEEPSDGSVKLSNGQFARVYEIRVEGKKPFKVATTYGKLSEADFRKRSMFYTRPENVPADVEEVELKMGSQAAFDESDL